MRLSISRWALYIRISVQYHSPRHQAGRSFEAAWSSSHVFWSRILDKCHAANTDVAKICQGDRPMEEHSESVAPMLMLLCLRTIGDSVDWFADILRKGKMHAKSPFLRTCRHGFSKIGFISHSRLNRLLDWPSSKYNITSSL